MIASKVNLLALLLKTTFSYEFEITILVQHHSLTIKFVEVENLKVLPVGHPLNQLQLQCQAISAFEFLAAIRSTADDLSNYLCKSIQFIALIQGHSSKIGWSKSPVLTTCVVLQMNYRHFQSIQETSQGQRFDR